MARSTHQRSARSIARNQHSVVTRVQLYSLGYSDEAIDHRVEKGRLFVLYRGVYALGRRELTREGEWTAAVLACGDTAALSHDSAAQLFGIDKGPTNPIHVSVLSASRSRNGIKVHRRTELKTTTHRGVPTTTIEQTLIDVSMRWPPHRLEAAIAEADKLGLIHPKRLRKAADNAGRAGARIRRLLDKATFRLTESELERRFLRIARSLSLPLPETQVRFGPYRADFYWPDYELVVETDGGRFHRTAAQQTRDRRMEQWMAARDYLLLRFTHAQVRFDPDEVATTLYAVVARRWSSARTKRSRSPSSTR